MTTIAALIALLAWGLGPLGVTAGLIILLVGACTDADKPKTRQQRIKLGLLIEMPPMSSPSASASPARPCARP